MTTAAQYIDSQGGTPIVLLCDLVSDTGAPLRKGTRGIALMGFRTQTSRLPGVLLRFTGPTSGCAISYEQVIAQPGQYAVVGRRIIPNPPPDLGSENFPPASP